MVEFVPQPSWVAVLVSAWGAVLIALQLVLQPPLHITFLLTSEPCQKFPPNPERPLWCWLWVAALPVEMPQGRLKDAPLQGLGGLWPGLDGLRPKEKHTRKLLKPLAQPVVCDHF